MSRILLVAYECDPERGSEYGRGWSWAFSYATQGHKVYCLTSQRGKEGIERAMSQHNYHNLQFVFVTVSDKLEKRYGQGTFWVYWHYWQWLNNAYKAAKQLHETINLDYVHHVSWGSIQQGTSLWRLPIPLVFGPAGGGQFAPKILRPYFLEGWKLERKRRIISTLLLKFNRNTRKTLRKAKLILADNRDTKILAKKFNPQTILINDPNVKANDIQEVFPHRVPTQNLRLIWVGRLLFRKGLPLVLEALAKVPAEIPVNLTIYGDGPSGPYIPDLIANFGLKERVIWKGQVPHQEVKEAYLRNDVFIFCPLRETLGEQFFEAMSYGLPIITLDLHGARTAVPNDGSIKVPVLKKETLTESIADAIVYLYLNPEKRLTMGKFNFAYIKEIVSADKVSIVLNKLNLPTN